MKYKSVVLILILFRFFGITGTEKVPQTQSFPSDHWAIVSFFKLYDEARKPHGKKRPASSMMS